MNHIQIGLLFIASYILGGIPTGYIIGRLKGIDIRQHGSGNPGTANVYRTLGKVPGLLTFFADFLKGFIPTLIAAQYFFVPAGALAIAGHIWTPFLRFHGGKGVATAAGVFMALLPLPTAGAFVVFAIAVGITSHISVGSMAASVALPVLCFALAKDYQRPFTLLALTVCVLIFYTHIANIRRILKGAELSFKHKREGAGKN
ncbi:MAG: acyl-phosphate glycerol 3-phosphate acyltransferase [Elusimicrobia bacterium HGW-Elusimicrobia-3]|nr:MAG: acyl-phosphate glycerol 3-phosphate acyltransferase [Elusimicrobia bacterium HGW-Elusimicrobia-3]